MNKLNLFNLVAKKNIATGKVYFFSSSSVNNNRFLQNEQKIDESFKSSDFLVERHIGPDKSQIEHMLKKLNLSSIQQLIENVIPDHVRDPECFFSNKNKDQKEKGIPERALTESEILAHMKQIANKNQVVKTYIGEGFYDTHTPSVILRNVFENPGWYTAYTPYQAEISQGRLENLLNFQTMIVELTGLDVSNASLLDESSAAAESAILASANFNGKRKKFFVSENAFPVTIESIKTRADQLNFEVIVGNEFEFDFEKEGKDISGVFVQNPNNLGQIQDYTELFSKVKQQKCIPIVACDLLSLTLAKTPKEMGAEIAIGNSQRFGVPMGYGGPHAAWMAAVDKFKRKLPGRIIGKTVDKNGNTVLRMALQTREQHIKREKATSNICTAQALLANMAAFYGIYHGPKGLLQISSRVNKLAQLLAQVLLNSGYEVLDSSRIFDTLCIKGVNAEELAKFMLQSEINVRVMEKDQISVSLDETTTLEDIYKLATLFQQFNKVDQISQDKFAEISQGIKGVGIKQELLRTGEFMKQQVFNSYHTETNMMRYLTFLERKDIALNKSMIALGSCTMKLNAASQLIPVSWPQFGKMHPYVPKYQAEGYLEMHSNMVEYLKQVTKFDAFSLQPNSGATGEYAGLLTIKGYQKSIGQGHRNICLIPTSAHGTNPASAILAGFKIVTVNSESENGYVDLEDLKMKAEKYKDDLACFMITYPSTFGIYEDGIKSAIEVIHQNGGQVYMDGANMNAQIGYTSPGYLGADVCHLNLHKTFAIPHGGGGPGLGPIGVKAHLAKFLPGHRYSPSDILGNRDVTISQSPLSSASIIPISYSYILQLGLSGLRRSTEIAILNANYLLSVLKPYYQIVYNRNGYCAHEFIIDIRPFKKQGIKAADISKRLQDFSFHSPTVSFPIPETLMIEPTESEDLDELNRLAEALIQIRKEIDLIESGEYKQDDNPLINAPHTQAEIIEKEWNHCYSREVAAFPLPWVMSRGKQWPPIGRADEASGDRNFMGVQGNERTF